MKYNLKEMSIEEKPREKLKKFGVNSLNDYELIALILKSGIKDKSVIDLSKEILNYYTNVSCLEEATLNELIKIKGLGEAKSIELLASIELGRRIYSNFKENYKISLAKDAYRYVQYDLQNQKQENFLCIYLDKNGYVITHKIISIGTSDQTNADYKTALKWALKFNASGIIFVHNHPSGNPMPSDADYNMTYLFERITKSVDLKYLDHIIVGKNSFFSFKKNSLEKV